MERNETRSLLFCLFNVLSSLDIYKHDQFGNYHVDFAHILYLEYFMYYSYASSDKHTADTISSEAGGRHG
jgi:hypothetical protein